MTMPLERDSFERINYSLRPAKNVERKMMAEVFGRLTEFSRMDAYRYIGFGSTYFSDFSLFHRSLGIIDAVSIEKTTEKEGRFRFNMPFACIDMRFGLSTDCLPELDWDAPTILWLDYDFNLTQSVFDDINISMARMRSGSIFVITVDAEPDDVDSDRMELLIKRVGSERLSGEITEGDVDRQGLPVLYRQLIDDAIRKALFDRNGSRRPSRKFDYLQLFNFHYRDGSAQMLTVGGIVFEESDRPKVQKCDFDSLWYIRPGSDFYNISIPKLTMRETRHLDAQLPIDDFHQLKHESIPDEDLAAYREIYRYFPFFVEADL